MPDTEVNAGAGSGQTGETVRITINNEDVEIPKELQTAAQKLVEMEANIQRGANQKFEEAKRITSLLKEDTDWYQNHPDAEMWKYYSAKSQGGTGQLVADSELEQYMRSLEGGQDLNEQRKPSQPAFVQAPEIRALTERLAKLEDAENRQAAQSVVGTVDTLLAKYPNSSRSEVLARIGLVFEKTHEHPTRQTIEEIVKKSHAEQTEWLTQKGYTKLEQKQEPRRPNVPNMRQGAATGDKPKLPPLSDFEAWGNRASERMKE